eukprot:2611501-Rhodomonas_salina.1
MLHHGYDNPDSDDDNSDPESCEGSSESLLSSMYFVCNIACADAQVKHMVGVEDIASQILAACKTAVGAK